MKISSGFSVTNAAKEMSNVKEIMDKSEAIIETLNKNAEVANSIYSDIDPSARAAKEAVEASIKELRTTEILNTRIAMALSENNINAGVWETSSVAERKEMMNKMFDIMLDEMQIPDNIRQNLQLTYSETPVGENTNSSGYCNLFIGLDHTGAFKVTGEPVVEMYDKLLDPRVDLNTALGSLYNQAIKVMQQTVCLDPQGTYADLKESQKWVDEVKDQIAGKSVRASDMQQFAVKAERDLLNRCRNIIKNQGILASQISFK